MRSLAFILSFLLCVPAHSAADYRVNTATVIPGVAYRTNYLKNPEFDKSNVLGITDASAITTIFSVLFGPNSLALTNTASGQIVKLTSNSIDPKLWGMNCEATFYYTSPGGTVNFKAYVLNGATKVTPDYTLTGHLGTTAKVSMYFPCGLSATAYDLTFESTSAVTGAIDVDSAFLGEANLGTATIESGWVDGGAIGLTAVSGGVVKGTVTNDHFWYKRNGANLDARIEYNQSAGGTNGSGDYLFAIPAASGCTIDTSKVTAYSGTVSGPSIVTNSVGNFSGGQTSNQAGTGAVVVYDSTHVRIATTTTAASGYNFISSSWVQMAVGNLSYTATLSVPCSGWAPLNAVSSQNANTDWADAGTNVFGATTTPPSKGSATITADHFWWKRDNADLMFRLEYTQTVQGTASNGSGDYLFTVATATGCTIDTTKLTISTTVGPNVQNGSGTIGSGYAVIPGTATSPVTAIAYSTTQFRLATGTTFIGAANYQLGQATVSYSVSGRVPCTGWQNSQNAPQLVNSVISNYSGVSIIDSARVTCGSASSAIVNQSSGSWSVANGGGAGLCTVTISPAFSSEPRCQCTVIAAGSASAQGCGFSAISSSSLSVTRTAAGAATNGDVEITCTGNK